MDIDLDNLFIKTRKDIIDSLIENNVNLDKMIERLGIDRDTFVKKMTVRDKNFKFYLKVLSLSEHWEVEE